MPVSRLLPRSRSTHRLGAGGARPLRWPVGQWGGPHSPRVLATPTLLLWNPPSDSNGPLRQSRPVLSHVSYAGMWSERGESNPHVLSDTGLSTLRACHFATPRLLLWGRAKLQLLYTSGPVGPVPHPCLSWSSGFSPSEPVMAGRLGLRGPSDPSV